MSGKHPKTTDSLMRYLRDQKGIAINGSFQKRKLMNIGYYHGYKGYRYINKATNVIPYTSFDELTAVYEFDSQLKALFYPFVMQIETALKNYVLETVVGTDAFGNGNKIAEHYLNKDVNLPIWAIFELLSLGEFGHFVSCLNFSCRQAISAKIGIRKSDDTNALMPQRLIYTTKDLRNAIAHNDVIFDTRFRTGSIDKQVSNAISNATGVSGLTFETVTDYLVLVVYQLSLLQMSKNDMKRLISSFVECTEKLRKAIPISVYSQIIRTDNNAKVAALRKFIKTK